MNAWTPASTSTWPAGESAHASAVDLLFIGLVATSALVLLLLFFLLRPSDKQESGERNVVPDGDKPVATNPETLPPAFKT